MDNQEIMDLMFSTMSKIEDGVKLLKKRSDLLGKLMEYYNNETRTFDIPKKWKSNRIRTDKMPAPTPRDWIHEMLDQVLTDEEKYGKDNFY